MATRKLATRVAVGGKWYGPDDDVPDDVAARITNPRAWAAEEDADADTGTGGPKRAGTTSGARLAARVAVDGRWYGPDTEVPDDVAARITNPKAWQDGVLPTLTAASGQDAAPAPGPGPAGGDVAGDEGEGVVAPPDDSPSGDVAGDDAAEEEPEPAARSRRGRRG